MDYHAHRISDENAQSILEHVNGTEVLARLFALPEWKDISGMNAVIHDIGKYAIAFQDKLNGKRNGYPHAAAGAIEIMAQAKNSQERMLACMMAYCIAGHHAGLPDGGEKDDMEKPTLYGTLAKKKEYTGNWDYSAYQDEILLNLPDSAPLMVFLKSAKGNPGQMYERYAFLTRYLFSCLTDADFLDTEHYYSPEIDRSLNTDFDAAEKAVRRRLKGFRTETNLQKARSIIQAQAFAEAQKHSGICTLNMPTGSGKTLCSLHIALQKIKASGGRLNRIIYVIPYTSIIEQTAAEFEKLIGEYVTVLQHHSNYSYEPIENADDIPDSDTAEKLKRACENWDAPIVITTSVQFFESLYHYKGSKLRKQHNLANAVIVLDEIHMLPVKQLQPCLSALCNLTQILHSEILMLSATMPDYRKQLAWIAPDCPVYDLITDTSAFKYFEKCSYHDLGQTDYETITMKAGDYQSCLIVVNSRTAAREVYKMLGGTKYHLSTYMTPHDRSGVIAEIRKKLGNEPITVVSTSLIEAGVDLDFETVFREKAGLDNILQSGGRCNREGLRDHGDVFIFRTDRKLQRDLAIRASIAETVMGKYDSITAHECITDYYNTLFHYYEKEIADKSIAKTSVMDGREGFFSIPFRTYAEQFEMIDTDTVSVVIPTEERAKELLNDLRFGKRSVLRELQQYSVSLRIHDEFPKVCPHIVSEFEHTGVCILNDESAYNPETGLQFESGEGIFVQFDEMK